jgi:phosphoglycolate/pyridoxal phosphate phosphatase family enzyme
VKPERLFAGYVLDLDGTVYLGDELLPGAASTLQRLRELGARIVFVTNNPLHSAAQYAERLTRLGVATTAEDVVTALDALALYLHAHHAGRTLLLIAEAAVDERLREEGFTVTGQPEEAHVVTVSFDREFDYAKLLAAYRAVRHHGAAIVATNPDPYCPTPDGGLPDCAAMLAALEACTGQRAEAIVGKPSAHMAAAFMARLDVDPADTAVVGDRLATDVAMAREVGAAGILVLTGATTVDAVATAEVKPDYVLDGIHQLLPDNEGPHTT